MAIRARSDNLSLDHTAGADRLDVDELWGLRDDLRSACQRMVGDAGRVDDVVQDTFVRALANIDNLTRRTSFVPWLTTVARRRSIDELRAGTRVRLVATTPESAMTPDGDPVEHVLRQEAIDRVRAACATLSPRERQLLLRQVTHGLSLAELAQEEATSIGSVRSVLARARTKLRAAVEKGGPLGAIPVPGTVAALRRRLHRWATRLDSRTPLLAGAATQLGDLVVAAVAAATLLAGAVPDGGPVRLVAAAAASEGAAREGQHDSAPGRRTSADAPGHRSEADDGKSPPTTGSPPTTAVPSPSEYADVPWIPDERAAQPDVVDLDSFAASADGSVVLAAGVSETEGWAALYRSSDGGHSWQRLEAAGLTGGRLLLPPSYPADPTILAVTEDGPLWRSDDHGRFFRPVATVLGTAASLVPGYGPGNRRVLLATPALVEYDVEGDRLGAPGVGPEVGDIGGLAPTAQFPSASAVLVGGHPRSPASVGTVFRCGPLTLDVCERTALAGSAAAPGVHVSASTPGLVIAHAVQMLYRSTDSGVTFSSVPLPAGFKVETVVDGAPGELLLAGTKPAGSPGSGVMRSTDGGLTWAPLGTTTALARGAKTVIRLASGRILAATNPSGGLLCSADNGATWAPRCPAPTGRQKG